MQVNFWRYAGSPKMINKNLPAEAAISRLSVEPFEPLDELSGYIIMQFNQDYYEMTMAGIGWKYYHITGRTALPGNRIRLDLRVDCIYTYKNEIYNQPANAVRTGNPSLQSPYVPDQKAPFESRYTLTQNQGDPFGNLSDDMILITVG